MMAMGLSFMFPTLSILSIPCLVLSGLCYGLGVGPVSFVLMSSLYPQKMKSAGVAVSQTSKAIIVLLQLKVGIQYFHISNHTKTLTLLGIPLPHGNCGYQWGFLHCEYLQPHRGLLLLPLHTGDQE